MSCLCMAGTSSNGAQIAELTAAQSVGIYREEKEAVNWHRQNPGEPYADWVSDDGVWLCAEGMDEAERKLGRPIALLMIDKGRHVLIGCFATLKEAKQAAEEF